MACCIGGCCYGLALPRDLTLYTWASFDYRQAIQPVEFSLWYSVASYIEFFIALHVRWWVWWASRLVTGTRRCDHIMPVLRLYYTSCRYAKASLSRLPPWSIGRCREICRRTQLTIVVLLPMLVSDSYAPRRTAHVSLYTDPQQLWWQEFLQLPAPDYGTVYHHILEMQTYRTVGSGGTDDILFG